MRYAWIIIVTIIALATSGCGPAECEHPSGTPVVTAVVSVKVTSLRPTDAPLGSFRHHMPNVAIDLEADGDEFGTLCTLSYQSRTCTEVIPIERLHAGDELQVTVSNDACLWGCEWLETSVEIQPGRTSEQNVTHDMDDHVHVRIDMFQRDPPRQITTLSPSSP